jgi:hypothetical protein
MITTSFKSLDCIDFYVEKLKFQEMIFNDMLKDPKAAYERTYYGNRTAFFGFTEKEMREIASHFNSKFYVFPDNNIKDIDFDFKDGYVFIYVRSNIPEEKVHLVKEVLRYYSALCEPVLIERKIFFVEAYENGKDINKYGAILNHLDYRINKKIIVDKELIKEEI